MRDALFHDFPNVHSFMRLKLHSSCQKKKTEQFCSKSMSRIRGSSKKTNVKQQVLPNKTEWTHFNCQHKHVDSCLTSVISVTQPLEFQPKKTRLLLLLVVRTFQQTLQFFPLQFLGLFQGFMWNPEDSRQLPAANKHVYKPATNNEHWLYRNRCTLGQGYDCCTQI